MKKKSLEGKQVAPVLAEMKLGEVEDWGVNRCSVVTNAIQRLKREKFPDRDWSVRVAHTILQVKRSK